ncbi:hypothetical protein C2S52_005518 [Perilla frutescens var. hirtella]|nr:hypothetical protein C2S52_005518 [Perilla frutescens var. hirtella]
MGGSKGGKHSKGKGKSKSSTNETSYKKPEALNSKDDLGQTSNNKAHGRRDSKGKRRKLQTPGGAKYIEKELQRLLLSKLEDLYAKAKGWLLASGYAEADVERAILNNGDLHGPKDVVDNILENTVAFLEQKVEANGEAFKDMKELCEYMLETLIDSVWDPEPYLVKTDAMWLLLGRNWGDVPSTSMPSRLLSGDENKDSITDGPHGSTSHSSNEGTSVPDLSSTIEKAGSELNIESSPEKVGILDSNVVDSDIPTFLDEECAESWKENSPNDLKTALIVDLMKSIRNLEEDVKVQKEWAQKKVIDSAKRLSKDLLELKTLRMEKEETQHMKEEKLCVEKSYMLMLKETEQSLRNVNCEASMIGNSNRTLEFSNAHIRADTEALRLSASEYGNDLNQVIQREMRCMKKLAIIGKQTSNLRAKCDEEKQNVSQLQLDIFQAEKEAKETEVCHFLEVNSVAIICFLC